jgi:DNA-binding XRE family transcriptional regulator
MQKPHVSPIGTSLAEARQRALADEEYRKLRARLSVAEAVARVLIQFRMKLNLTQEQLAQLMNTSASTISRLEGGRHVPSLATLARVLEAGGMRLVLGFERPGATAETGERIVVSV